MMQALRILLSIALLALVVWLGMQLYKTIEEPIVFQQEQEKRDEVGQSKLRLIRELQLAYKATNDTFADSFENLVKFGKMGNLTVERIIGDPNDSTVVSRTEIDTIAVRDSILSKTKFKIDEIAIVPHGLDGGEKFDIQAGTVVKNDLEIPAFEVSTPYKVLYKGLIKKYYADKLNKNIRIGSMEDGSTSGNF